MPISQPIRVTIFHEHRHEKVNPEVAAIYPHGMHEAIAAAFRPHPSDFAVRLATQDDAEHGLSQSVIDQTDVLIWWGHKAHREIDDAIVDRVHARVLNGMGFIALHSSHFSKVFIRLMGTSCSLKWRALPEGEREILWVSRPNHPIVAGIGDHFVLEQEEMYGEFFDVPEPESTFLISSFTGGEVFRSGCTWTRGAGRVVYFRPGHETFPTYHHPAVLRVIQNAARWAAPTSEVETPAFGRKELGWWK